MASEKAGDKFPVPFDTAWGVAGYARKDNAKRVLIRSLAKGEQYISSDLRKTLQGGRPSELIDLSIDGFKHFCLMAETVEGKQIRQYFIEADKELRQLKIDREFPNQITGIIAVDPATRYFGLMSSAIDIIFSHVDLELRTGMKIEGTCKKYPELREVLEPFKPKLILGEYPLLSPTKLGELLEAKDGFKRTPILINKLLIANNLQVATGSKNPAYRAIGRGVEFSKVVADTALGHGKTVQSLRWYESVLDLIEAV